jgi:hypothetical protein
MGCGTLGFVPAENPRPSGAWTGHPREYNEPRSLGHPLKCESGPENNFCESWRGQSAASFPDCWQETTRRLAMLSRIAVNVHMEVGPANAVRCWVLLAYVWEPWRYTRGFPAIRELRRIVGIATLWVFMGSNCEQFTL